jgi:hypothetical protein
VNLVAARAAGQSGARYSPNHFEVRQIGARGVGEARSARESRLSSLLAETWDRMLRRSVLTDAGHNEPGLSAGTELGT